MLLQNDCGGRRTGIDRRQFSYTYCIPEKRSGSRQRYGMERRNIFIRFRLSKQKNHSRSGNDFEFEAA